MISFGFSIILIRLIEPRSFGVIAMIAPLLLFQNLFHSFGTANSIISKSKINQNEINSLIWAKLFFSILINIIFLLASDYIVIFFNEPDLKWIIYYFAISSIFYALYQVYLGLNYRELKFNLIATIDLISFIIASSTAVFLAIQGEGLLALVIRDFLLIIIPVIIIIAKTKQKLSFRIKWKEIVYYFRFGTSVTLNAIINFFSRNLDDILIGRKYGSSELGYYSKSYSLLTLPHALLSNIAVMLGMPVISRKKNDKDALEFYKKICRIVFALNIPIALVLYFTCDDFVPIIFTVKWNSIIPFIKLFALLSIFQVIGPLDNLIYEGRNKTKYLLVFGILLNSLIIIAIILGFSLTESTYGIAQYYVFGSVILFIPSQYLLAFTAKGKILELIINLIHPFITMILTSIFWWMIQDKLPGQNKVLSLTLEIVGIPLTYLIILFITNTKKSFELVKTLKQTVF